MDEYDLGYLAERLVQGIVGDADVQALSREDYLKLFAALRVELQQAQDAAEELD